MAVILKRQRATATERVWGAGWLWQRLPSIMALAAIWLVLFLGHLALVNDLATKGYELDALSTAKARLEREAKEFAVQTAQLESLGALTERVTGLSFQAVDRLEYVRTPGSVAMNR